MREVSKKRPVCGEGEMWPITRPGAVQKPDVVTVCNKGEGCAKMTTRALHECTAPKMPVKLPVKHSVSSTSLNG